ncbi:ferritin, heavy subunit-like [Watersipora subatra]|uniref:ferritin, heavy subunit-like n=1 Tax=Watersipora subatra TaxID=2589382 RepID=UPI00355C907B
MASLCRQNYHEECEAGVNKQINMELYASYVYLSLASHFNRDDIGLANFAAYFRKASDEERDHAQKLIQYQNLRGGRVVFKDIKAPEKSDWGSGLDAMKTALELEKNVNQSLLDLHKIADGHNDPQMCDFLEGNYLAEQVDAINELAKHIANLQRVGSGLGEYQFDRHTLA